MRNVSLDIPVREVAEETFRLAVESSLSGVVMTDGSGKIVLINNEIERLFGYRRKELIGKSVEMLVPLQRRARSAQNGSRSNGSRHTGGERDFCGLRKGGAEFPIEVGLSPIRVGKALYVLSAIVDISERRRGEELFRLAVEACPRGMAVIDSAGKIVLINAEIERLFGYSSGELIGQPVEMLWPERVRRQDHWEFATRPDSRRAGAGRDLFGLRKDGTEFPVEVGLNSIHAGSNLLILSVVEDITERQRSERLKDEFVSTVSHELRTPMTSIFGSLGLLVGGAAGPLPASATRLLAIAHENCQRLVRLINDILDIQKLETGRVVFDLKPVEVRPLIANTIEAMRGYADAYRVRIRLDSSTAPALVMADADRLAQVVTNLLSNAIKFSPPDGEVVIGVAQRDSDVIITVRDHGSGIPDEFKSRIFGKFAQAEGTDARLKGGTGLGLSIVKEIVVQLGGQVGFDDAAGGGTVFSVELPAWEEAGVAKLAPGIAENSALMAS